MSNGVNNPDFETLYIRRPQSATEKKQATTTANVAANIASRSSSTARTAPVAAAPAVVSDVRKLENESVKLATAPRDMGIAIQQARSAKKLTQDQLDQQCSFPKGTIKSYENGTAIVNGAQLQRINRVLGINLKKPNTKRAPTED